MNAKPILGWSHIAAGLLLSIAAAHASAADFAFVHPGLLHSKADLARMKDAVAAKQEPIFSGYQKLLQSPESRLTYKMQGPLPAVGRNGGAGKSNIYDDDATAAYQMALLWTITGDRAYADHAKEIINAWSKTLKKIDGRDAVLMAGLAPFKMVNAAEILRYTDTGWTDADARQAEACFREAVYPTIKDFALYANGNWDTAAMKTVIAIGIYCNDRTIFDSGMRYYVDGAGDGSLTHYIINDKGQCQESGRDAGHSQLGIGHLGDCCEMAWNQGLDLYGYADNRLLKGFEYAAVHNMGGTVPFDEMIDRTGKYPWAVIAAPGPLRPIYEQIYNHYVMRQGLDSSALQRAVESIRPEGPSSPIGDHSGFGTLLYARPKSSPPATQATPTAIPATPAALVATPITPAVHLTWVPSISADTYTVKRGTKSGGPYTVLARNLKAASFNDQTVEAGTLYYYTVAASNKFGESPDTSQVAISAGLPSPWQEADIGDVKLKGWTRFDGQVFTLDGSGKQIGGTRDQCHFTYTPLHGDGTITARFLPQMSAMGSQFGVMMRETADDTSASVALILQPATGDIESPGYEAVLLSRLASQGQARTIARYVVPEPLVSDGRFLQPLWLRLTRSGNHFAASVSLDGDQWNALGNGDEVPLKPDLLAGLPVCSNILRKVGAKERAMDTVIRFDHVRVTQPAPK